MKNYVQINSQVTVQVTCGLQFKDKTNPNSRLENSMKIDPIWAKLCVVVKKGIHWYPSEIVEWHSFKRLVEHNLASIATEADECDDGVAIADKKRIVNTMHFEGLDKPTEEPKKRGHRKHEEEKPVEPIEEPKDEAPKGDSLEDIAGDDEDEKEGE